MTTVVSGGRRSRRVVISHAGQRTATFCVIYWRSLRDDLDGTGVLLLRLGRHWCWHSTLAGYMGSARALNDEIEACHSAFSDELTLLDNNSRRAAATDLPGPG